MCDVWCWVISSAGGKSKSARLVGKCDDRDFVSAAFCSISIWLFIWGFWHFAIKINLPIYPNANLSASLFLLINIYCRHYTHIFLGNTLCPQDRESAKCVCLLAWVWLTYLSLQPSGTPAKDLTTAAAKMALKWVCVLCVYASVFFNIHTQAISARSICLNSKLQHTRCQSRKNKKYTYPVK